MASGKIARALSDVQAAIDRTVRILARRLLSAVVWEELETTHYPTSQGVLGPGFRVRIVDRTVSAAPWYYHFEEEDEANGWVMWKASDEPPGEASTELAARRKAAVAYLHRRTKWASISAE